VLLIAALEGDAIASDAAARASALRPANHCSREIQRSVSPSCSASPTRRQIDSAS
jgi:hypothetical protein